MTKVTLLRHTDAEYPDDKISPRGREMALSARKRLPQFDKVLSSPQKRAIETAKLLGHNEIITDARLSELELPNINAPSAHEYVIRLHNEKREELDVAGQAVQTVLKELRGEDQTLIVSHNAVMSAVYRQLTGEITSFNNLEGFAVDVDPEGILKLLAALRS